ncbi:DNA polymerase/3'-5' exonuclease PolX [Thermoflavimicrobium daqui]|uniref:DNA-directed DNA polymerase n=1 Tax=Thermoflavimicrobium daqui TaxID=2137476 RepID=A0A364K991_9BACL|nr:DNA polymerase/3'-5' exonuclease PolX [Thermoflavimicrobium daqui]RAL26792.1 DNA polymerase/3'-5' exonuclease PolX [Thermoflavimicrobium daqui]
MNNKQIANTLHQLADFLEMKGENTFKVQAYRRAARAVESSRVSLTEIQDQLEQISGIGKGTASIIREIIETGQLAMLEEIRLQLPPELPKLLHLPGLGPKSIYTLYQQLGITNINELKELAEQQKVRSLPGFGPKKEEKILAAIENYSEGPARIYVHQAMFVAESLRVKLSTIDQVEQVELAGSIRRWKETIKDIDFVVATVHPIEVGKQIVSWSEVKQVIGQGETKVSITVDIEGIVMGVDFRLVTPEQFASSLHHFTGSKEHNVRIRQRAKQYGWKVSEYGIEDTKTKQMMTFQDEQALFAKLELPWIPPELREDRGEIEKAEQNQLPTLVQLSDYRGDLHMHTLYSDGANTVREMAEAAKELGYEYIAITDHSRSLKVARGLSIEEVYEQWEEIDKVNQMVEGITILKGAEVDILTDGTLDYPDDLLQGMDIVIASIHSQFRLDEKAMTRRIIRAIEHPLVNIIAHPTGRLLLRRDPYEVNMDELFQAARDTGTILELNANPYRLDLKDTYLQQAKEEYGLKFTINTDAHAIGGLSQIQFGIATARRGWLEKEDVINTYSLSELKQVLRKK